MHSQRLVLLGLWMLGMAAACSSRTDDTAVPPATATCGNGVVEAGEQCDSADRTACGADCKAVDLCKEFAITAIAPPGGCSADPMPPKSLELTASGAGFLKLNGKQPIVTFNGQPAAIVSMSNKGAPCTANFGGASSLDSCSTMVITIPTGLAAGKYVVDVVNPIAQKCATHTAEYVVADAPAITSLDPALLCEGVAGEFDINGTGFSSSTSVTVDGKPVSSTFVSPTKIHVKADSLAAGMYDVTVSNGPNCASTKVGAIQVPAAPLVLFVSPTVVWDGATTLITVYTGSLDPPVKGVSIKLNGSMNMPTDLMFTTSMAHPERPLATVPKGTAVGSYDVTVTDTHGCKATLDNAFSVTNTTTLNLLSVTPSYAPSNAATPVTVTASTVAPSTGFVGIPIVYLAGGALMTPASFSSVAVNTPASLSAVLPAGTPEGTYDLVVVNDNKTVGVLPASFHVVAPGALPTIKTVSPAIVPNNGTATLSITGTNFAMPTVKLTCINPQKNPIADVVATILANPVPTATSMTVTAPLTGAAFAAGANCVVVVTNAAGPKAEYSSVVVITPQQNLTNFFAGPDLNVGRRGLSGAAGRASDAARFIYAIAGDDGTNALKSVETLGVDVFGLPAAKFFVNSNTLVAARTLAGSVAIGRFVYMVGGLSTVGMASSALASVERAAILDSQFYPQDLGVDITLSKTDGLTKGLYHYRVAAVMSMTDPFNPGGETLPTAPFGIILPDTSAKGYKPRVTLSWTAVNGATGYRIYRTVADAAAGSETLIADTGALPVTVTCSNATTCTDLGATPGMEKYLVPGSIGVWTTLTPKLTVARHGAGVTSAVDPAAPNKVNIYVLGGFSAAAAPLDSYEYLTITLNADGSQTPAAAFTTGATKLTAARGKLGAYSATMVDSKVLDGTYLWAGSGASNVAGTTMLPNCNFDFVKVQNGGALGNFTNTFPVGDTCPGAGYGAFSAPGDFLYALGGQDGLPNVSNVNAQYVAPPGKLTNFQGFQPGLLVNRVDLGAAVQSGNFWALAGRSCANPPCTAANSNPGTVLKSTEYVLY